MVVLEVVINILLVIASLVMTVTVLLQSSEENGMSAITGGSDSRYTRSKAKSIDDKLALITKICAVAFVALSFVYMLVVK